tara:strand:- start:185 stop:1876 length:1692 start_codon:yes stop_codon:yes gene_type:complete
MAEKINIEVDVDYKGAVDNLEKIKDEVVDLGKTTKAQKQVTSGLAQGFKGVGLAMKAAGFGIILKLVDMLASALMQNQEVVDTVSTAFNIVGIVMNKIITTFKTIFDRVSANNDNFDALGRIIMNLMTLALTPLRLQFYTLALVLKEVQLAWEKSWFGQGDIDKINKLTKQVKGYQDKIKKTAEDALEAGKNIVNDFKEGVDEITNIATVVQEEFTNTLDDMTVKSVLNQARGITRAKNNIALLGAEQEKLILLAQDEAEAQRIIRDDISKTFEERLEANRQLLVLSEKARILELEGTRKQIASLNAQLAIDSKNVDLLTQKKELENNLIEIGLREKALKKEQKEQENALLQEQNAILQELSRIGVEEQDRRKLEFEQEKQRLLKLADLTISNAEKLAKTKLRIEEDYQKKKDALDKENTAKEKALQDQKRQIIGSALTGITALVGAETKTGKALAVAQATMDTYAGATKALAQGGLFGAIGAAGIVASGLANVRNILQTDVPGQPDGGDNPPPPDVIQDVIPTVPTFGAIGTEPPPVQAFVVESDVSSSQALQNDLNLQATL